ncbi:TPA: phage tail protein [Citrobacter rodentium]|nr:phage tail protein [Citrobacter rodentium]
MTGDTTNRLAGTAYVTVNGVTVMVEGSFKYQAAKVNRTSLVGMDGVHGYKEKPVASYISARLRDSGGTVVAGFNDQTNVNVIAELANGKTIIGRSFWTVNVQEVESEDAVFDVRWEGRDVTEN